MLDTVEALLARGDVADVVTFCELAVAYLEANAPDIADPAPLVGIAERLGELTARARAATGSRPPRSVPRCAPPAR